MRSNEGVDEKDCATKVKIADEQRGLAGGDCARALKFFFDA